MMSKVMKMNVLIYQVTRFARDKNNPLTLIVRKNTKRWSFFSVFRIFRVMRTFCWHPCLSCKLCSSKRIIERLGHQQLQELLQKSFASKDLFKPSPDISPE